MGSVIPYKGKMRFIHYAHKKFILPVLVVSIALSLCPVDHLTSMAEASGHSKDALSECMPDVCATLESKQTVPQERLTRVKILPLPDALFMPLSIQMRTSRMIIVGDSSPPTPLNKLYALHATYLI